MTRIQKWGNSLAVRIPVAVAGQLQVEAGTEVDMEVRDGELILRPATNRNLSLKELLRDCTPSRLHGETDFGPDIGREVLE